MSVMEITFPARCKHCAFHHTVYQIGKHTRTYCLHGTPHVYNHKVDKNIIADCKLIRLKDKSCSNFKLSTPCPGCGEENVCLDFYPDFENGDMKICRNCYLTAGMHQNC